MIINVKYEDAGQKYIGFNVDSQYFSVYEGSAAYRKHVQPYLDGGGTIEPYVAPEKSWEQSRIEEYGSVTSQLDEIYHDMDAWKARIAAVKVKHPKK